MKNLSFDHVHYRYTDEQATRHFYVDILEGIEEQPVELINTPNMQFSLGGVKLLFAPAGDSTARAVPAHCRLGVYHIAFLVEDCEAATSYYRDRGASVAIEPFCASDSIRASFLCGPDGMWVELKQNLKDSDQPCQGCTTPQRTDCPGDTDC